ncbi:MAG: Rab family GTPase [Candidatus Thorarchaeota archaeon]
MLLRVPISKEGYGKIVKLIRKTFSEEWRWYTKLVRGVVIFFIFLFSYIGLLLILLFYLEGDDASTVLNLWAFGLYAILSVIIGWGFIFVIKAEIKIRRVKKINKNRNKIPPDEEHMKYSSRIPDKEKLKNHKIEEHMVEGRTFRFKITVVGDSQVGKTNLMKRFTSSSRAPKMIEVQFSVFENRIENDIIRLLFYDIAGSDTFSILRKYSFKNSKAAIIVFSLERNTLGFESFNHILKWQREILKACGEIPIFIFANKVDLVDDSQLDDSKMEKLVKENNFRGYYYTSVEVEENIMKAFNDISLELYEKYKKF